MNLQDLANQYLTNKFTFYEPSGNVLDSKGSAIGTIGGGVTRVEGWNGEGFALSFDGSTGYVQFNQSVLPIGKKSIRFKVRATGEGEYSILDNSGNTANLGTVVRLRNGKIIVYTTRGVSGTQYNLIESNKSVNDGQWHDVLYTWDGTTNANGIKLFVDDMVNPDKQLTATVLETQTPTTNLTIGRNAVTQTTMLYFGGQIDNIEIYNEDFNAILNRKYSVLLNNNDYYSLDTKTIIHIPSASSKNMILHGIEQGKEIQLDELFDKVKLIKDTSEVLGEGKTFTHTIDLNEWKVKKIIL